MCDISHQYLLTDITRQHAICDVSQQVLLTSHITHSIMTYDVSHQYLLTDITRQHAICDVSQQVLLTSHITHSMLMCDISHQYLLTDITRQHAMIIIIVFMIYCKGKYIPIENHHLLTCDISQQVLLASHQCQKLVDVVSLQGNRMFSFVAKETDFYIPQLINMYIHMHDVAEAIHPYLLYR